MKKSLFFDFSVDKKTKTITVKREFAASLPSVWDAWTNANILDKWWASKGWVCQTKSMKFKEGGFRHYMVRGPEGEEHWSIMNYTNIQLHKEFSGTECFADENAMLNKDIPQSEFRIVFEEKNGRTFIEHFTTYLNLEDLEASLKYGFKEGTIDAFERLDETLETKK